MNKLYWGVLLSIIGNIIAWFHMQGQFKYEWMRQCHGELVGLVVDPSGLTFDHSKTEVTKTDTNGESWWKLYEPYTVTINSYGHTSTTTRHNIYWKAPDGSIYDEQPDFL